jgi:hypothetical protein
MTAAKGKPAEWASAEETQAKLTPLEAIEAEVDLADATVEVSLGDTKVRVRPVGEWRSSSVRAMREGDFDAWAQKALVDGDYEIWQDVDPTISECEAFFKEWGVVTGQDSGKSGASRRSSRSTARR